MDSVDEENVDRSTWVQIDSPLTNLMSFHASARINHLLLTYGGYKQSLDQAEYLDTCSIFDLKTYQWFNPMISGTPLNPICTHSINQFSENKLIVFGGMGPSSSLAFSSISILTLDFDTPFMIQHEILQEDEDGIRRSLHSAEVYQNGLYVFGGNEEKFSEAFNELWRLDLENFTWTQCKCRGDIPSPRLRHKSVIVKNKMYIFGGRNNIEPFTRNNDLFSFDFDLLKWTQIQCQGLLPTPRNGMSLVQNDDILYLFGGYLPTLEYSEEIFQIDLKDTNYHQWEIIPTKNKSPGSRANHTCVFYKNNLYVIAGQRGDKCGDFLCDIFALQISPAKLIKENKRLTNYVSQINSLYSNKLFSDICFLVENQEFPAHKNILAMRSEYFASMFLSGMQESQARQINIPDVTAITFQAFLEYIYSNQIDLTYHLAKDLLVLSNKWLVSDLEERCKKYLKTRLSHENYTEIGQLAYFIKDDGLLQASIQFEIQEKMENFNFQHELGLGCTQLP